MLGSEEGVEKAVRRQGREGRKKMAKEVGSGGVATEEDERSTRKLKSRGQLDVSLI